MIPRGYQSTELEALVDKMRIRMVGKLDGTGKRYFFTTCSLPVLLDLSDCVLHLFCERNMESAELVVRHYDPKGSTNDVLDDTEDRK